MDEKRLNLGKSTKVIMDISYYYTLLYLLCNFQPLMHQHQANILQQMVNAMEFGNPQPASHFNKPSLLLLLTLAEPIIRSFFCISQAMSFHLYPANFEDDDVPDPDGSRQETYSLLTLCAALAQTQFESEVPDTGKKRIAKMQLSYPAASTGSLFAVAIIQSREKLAAYIGLVDEYARAALAEIPAQIERQRITVRKNKNPDCYSQQNLLISHGVARHVQRILVAAKQFVENGSEPS